MKTGVRIYGAFTTVAIFVCLAFAFKNSDSKPKMYTLLVYSFLDFFPGFVTIVCAETKEYNHFWRQ